MVHPYQAGNSTVTSDNLITALLDAPLGPGWTVEGLAERLLGEIAANPSQDKQEFVVGADTSRQARRLIRPLLACLAVKSAAEAGTPPEVHGGQLLFKRLGVLGPVCIHGRFENRPGNVRVTLRRSNLPPEDCNPPESGEIGIVKAPRVASR